MKQGWTYKKLGELGTIVTGSTPSTKMYHFTGISCSRCISSFISPRT